MSICGKCLHFHAGEADPLAIGSERQGECRGAPPSVVAIPVKQPGLGGGMGLVLQSCYPVIPQGFPACASFKAGRIEPLLPLLPHDISREEGV